MQYAENPPKKYQDIYPFDFENEDWQGLFNELKGIFLHWIGQGVTVFRVDNPHTKPFALWEWLIAEIKKDHPETIFLAEAFTRPRVMHRLAKLGYSQSYTYFTWRNTKAELVEYATEADAASLTRVFPPELLAEHAGHPAGIPSAWRSRRFHDAPGAGRNHDSQLRHLRSGL